MPFYLASYIGSGTILDSFRPRGSDQTGWSASDLRPDGGATLGGGGLNACLLFLPVANPDPLLRLIGLAPSDVLGPATMTAINSRLGTSYVPGFLSDVLWQIMTSPPVGGWKPLRPGIDGFLHLHLGAFSDQRVSRNAPTLPLLVGMVATQHRISRRAALAALLTGTLVFSRPKWGHALSFSENWNCADADVPLTCQLAWSALEATGIWGIRTNVFKVISTVSAGGARADSDVATSDHAAQATLTGWTRLAGSNGAGVLCRKDATGTLTFYLLWATDNGATNTYQLYKDIAGSFTQLGANAGSPVAGDLMKVQANGSAISGFVNGVEIIGPITDTAIPGNLRGGVRGQITDITNTVTFDNWSIADLAAAAATPLRTLTGVGL